jgi:adenosine deaminase
MILLFAAAVLPGLAGPALPPDLRARFERVEWTPEAVERLVREMPKVETHLHLDGTLSPELVQRLAREQGLEPLAGLPLDEIRQRVVVGAPRESLAAVLAAFGTVYPLLRDPAALRTVAYELVAAASRQGTRHVEVRFAPALQVAPGFDERAALDAVLEGLAQGRAAFGVGTSVIVCLIRPPSFVDLDTNRRMVELAIAARARGVVGIDLAGDEAAAPLDLYADLFRRAREGGLALSAHAGEAPGSGDLETALALGVDRLGHATLLGKRPDLLAEVVRRRIPVEVNLTYNLRTGAVASLAAHPVRSWFDAGVPIALSTDDPGLFAIDLPGEYLLLHRELGFAPAELAAVALQGFEALFLPSQEKERLRAGAERDLGRLLDELATR